MILTNSHAQNKIISPKSRSDYSLSPERDEAYHLSLDKDEYFHLSSEINEVYYSLLRTLKRKKGFGLFFVVLSSQIKIDNVITRLQKDLPQKNIHDLEIDRQAKTLYDQIDEIYQQTKCDILCFKNLDSALYDYEDTKRLSGWSEEEAYAYSWKGVPPILNHLNQQRERLSRDFPFSFVFFVPSFAIDYLIQRAPDFFDWRSGVFRFPFTDQELSEQLTEFIHGDLDTYLNFTPEQRVEKILGIRDLILAVDRDAESIATLYFEQSLLFLSGNQYNKAIERLNKVIELQQNNYKALVYKSFILIKCEHYEEALICLDKIIDFKFTQVVELKPNDHQIWAMHGDVLRKLERYEEALVSYDKAINVNPSDHQIWAIRGDVLRKLERYEEAFVSYDKAINVNSDNHQTWAIRGDILRKLERYEEALVSYDKAININPNDHQTWAIRGDILRRLERYEEALVSYDKAININSDNHQIWAIRGDVLRKLERYEEALVSYDKAINVNPSDHQIWAIRGDVLRKLERYEEALVSYDKAINVNPSDHQIWAIRGDVLRKLERYEEALISYDRAININSDDYKIWIIRSDVLRELERYEEALVSYNKVIKLQPNDDISWNNCGAILANKERYNEALFYFNKAIELKPDEYQYLGNLAIALQSLKRYEEAIEIYKKAIELKPDEYQYLGNLAIALQSLERYEEAIETYKKAIKIDKHSTFYNNLSRLYFLQGESQLAITLLTRAIEAKLINDSFAWNNLGFLYLITNNLKKARISFNSALQRKANDFFPTFNLALVNTRQNKIKLAKQLIEKSLNLCENDTIQDKLYLAITKIALRKEKDSLQNIKNILESAKRSSLSLEQEIRCGVLESAQILAECPDFSDIKAVVNIFEQALQIEGYLEK